MSIWWVGGDYRVYKKMFNINSGYGKDAQVLLGQGIAGKVFIVANQSGQAQDFIKQIFKANDETPRAFASIEEAIASAVANRGDVIYVLPGYTETRTTALTVNKAGIAIIGLGFGRSKPVITGNGVIDAVNITAANVLFQGFHFAAPETDEQTAFINIAGAGVTVRDITAIGSQTSKNVVDCITIASGADDLTLEKISIWNTVVAVNSFLSIEAAVARMVMKDVFFFGNVVAAGVIDAAAATQMYWENVKIGVVGTSKAAIVLDSNPTGMIVKGWFSGTITTLASNANYGNALRLFDVKVLEETNASAQGALIPALDTD